MIEYGYNCDCIQSAAIFEKGTKAEECALSGESCDGFTEGIIIGTSEWIWLDEDNAKRICAALQFFSETSTEEMEQITKERGLF